MKIESGSDSSAASISAMAGADQGLLVPQPDPRRPRIHALLREMNVEA